MKWNEIQLLILVFRFAEDILELAGEALCEAINIVILQTISDHAAPILKAVGIEIPLLQTS